MLQLKNIIKCLAEDMSSNFRQTIDWKTVKTINGYNAKILYSVINKELRRGILNNSVAVAKELFDSGTMYQIKLWQRLITVTAEDVGLGNVGLYIYVCSAYEDFIKTKDFEIIHKCIVQICKSQKSRYADELLNYALLTYIEPYIETSFQNITAKQLKEALEKKDLDKAIGAFVALCFRSGASESSAWRMLEKDIPDMTKYIEQARNISLKIKPKKNDRFMAGVLYIAAYIMQIPINEIQTPVHIEKKMHLWKPRIPEYALDLHANITDKKLSIEDFKIFWNESSKINNEIPLEKNVYYSPKYKQYILNHLDDFLRLYYLRKI